MNKADKAEIKAMVSGLFADMKNDIVNDIRGNAPTKASKANKKASKADKSKAKGPKVFKNKWDKEVSYCEDCGRNHIVGSAPYEACFGKAPKAAPKASKPNKASKPKASKPKAKAAPKSHKNGKLTFKEICVGKDHNIFSDGKILRRPSIVKVKGKEYLNIAKVRADGTPATAILADIDATIEFLIEAGYLE